MSKLKFTKNKEDKIDTKRNKMFKILASVNYFEERVMIKAEERKSNFNRKVAEN